MGPDHVMLGSDDPFPLGEEQPGRLVRGSVHLTVDQKEAVLGHNAVRFFDL
jgi:aminocarboxymuconate-semialdehyde decarboxylase